MAVSLEEEEEEMLMSAILASLKHVEWEELQRGTDVYFHSQKVPRKAKFTHGENCCGCGCGCGGEAGPGGGSYLVGTGFTLGLAQSCGNDTGDSSW